jgi:small subunit ribosomal protein S17e
MGKTKVGIVKRLAKELLEAHPDKFSASFEENKRLVKELVMSCSKKVRNEVAGYIVRLKKAELKRSPKPESEGESHV